MQPSANPYTNENGLIQKYIGTAYENVRTVAAAMEMIKFLSDNMQSIYDFAAAKEGFEAFNLNPDFLQWLIDNKDTLDALSLDLSSLVQDYAPLAGADFIGYTKLGLKAARTKEVHLSGNTPALGATMLWPHNENPAKIVGISGVVHKSDGIIEALGNVLGNSTYARCDADHFRLSTEENAIGCSRRPFFATLVVIE